MQSHASLGIVLGLAILLPSTDARAQSPFDLGVSFDESSQVTGGVIPGFAAPGRLYFMMFDLGQQIVGYENSVSITGPNSSDWVITRGSPMGLDLDPDADGYVVGIGVCAGTVGHNYTINTYDFGYFSSPDAPPNTLVCASAPTVGNPSIPGFPSYQTCSGDLQANGFVEARLDYFWICPGCALINPEYPYPCVNVPTEQTSWGALKSKF